MTTWGSRCGVLAAVFMFGLAPLTACGDDGDSSATDTATTDTATTDTVTDDAIADDTSTADDTATAEDTTAANVTFDGPHAIFAAKCSPCHTGAGSGGHNIGESDLAAAFADAEKDAQIGKCDGLTKGACTIVRIQAGDMPKGAGCTGDPSQDSGNASCLTQAEQDTIQAWIDAGIPGPAE